MSDKKQLIIPPGARLPAQSRTSLPHVPELPSGTSAWITERGRYERNALTVDASTRFIQAKSAQYAAFSGMVAKKEALMLALASYDDLPEKISHQRALGRISRTAELRREELQHQIAEINLKIEVAAANMRLAEYLPIRETPSSPPPPPAPMGLTPADIQKAAQMMPEMKPETIETLVLVLSGLMAEKNK